MRTLLLPVLLAVCVTAGAEEPQQYVKKINTPIPEVDGPGTVKIANPSIRRRDSAATPAAPVPAPVAQANPLGLPMIPASDPTNTATVPTPNTPAPVAAGPVQPVATFATMAQAAAAGVDPFKENKPAGVSVSATPAKAAPAPFDITNPAGWLAWLQANKEMASRYALVAMGILAAALVGFKLMTWRSGRE
jgi:hypothetical protein